MSEPIFQFGIRKFSSVFPFMSLSLHPEKNPSSDSRSYLDGEGCLEKRTWGITKVTVPSGATYFRFDVPLLYSLYIHTHIILFIYFWLCCVFGVALWLFSLWWAGATLLCSAQASHCGGFSCCRTQALGCSSSVVAAPGPCSACSVVVVLGVSCSSACGIFPA